MPARAGEAKEGSGVMVNVPVCLFGPGGDFVNIWPESCEPMVVAPTRSEVSVLDLAKRLGLQAPLVSVGPSGIAWERIPSESLERVIRAASARTGEVVMPDRRGTR